MKEAVQIFISFWEIYISIWFVGRWAEEKPLQWAKKGLWYVCVWIWVGLLFYQKLYTLYSRWFLILEVFIGVQLVIWKYRIQWKKALLMISILYESIYMFDLFFLVLVGYHYGLQELLRLQGGISLKGIFFQIISRSFVSLFFYFLCKKRHIYRLIEKNNWKILCLIPIAQHSSLLICDIVFYNQEKIVALKSLFIFFLIYLCLIFFLVIIYIQEREKYARRISEERTNVIRQKYQEMIVDNQERDILVHDIQNHLIVLDGILRGEEINRALEYVKKIQKDYRFIRQKQETGNVIVDTILENKAAWAGELDIKMKIVYDDISYSFVTDEDWCCILANLLDNAIEASLQVKYRRWIKVRLEDRPFGIVLYIENNCENKKIETGGRIETTKKDIGKHGIGLQSVKCAIEKYKGTMIYECENGVFKINVILYR